MQLILKTAHVSKSFVHQAGVEGGGEDKISVFQPFAGKVQQVPLGQPVGLEVETGRGKVSNGLRVEGRDGKDNGVGMGRKGLEHLGQVTGFRS